MDRQQEAEEELEVCHQKAMGLEVQSDPVFHWIACYEKLIKKMDTMERDIKEEFSNFI
jgi:hypothetical protein